MKPIYWGALQFQDRSPQSRNGWPVESCNASISWDRSATARLVSDCGLLRLPRPLERGHVLYCAIDYVESGLSKWVVNLGFSSPAFNAMYEIIISDLYYLLLVVLVVVFFILIQTFSFLWERDRMLHWTGPVPRSTCLQDRSCICNAPQLADQFFLSIVTWVGIE